jgi:hypothetical protein
MARPDDFTLFVQYHLGLHYDLPGKHGEAQVMALDGDLAATLAFARTVYDEYRARLGHKRVRTFDEDDDDETVSDKVHISDIPIKRQT